MRKWIRAAGLATMALAGAARAETASFKDWTAVCDNVRTCAAFGFSPEAADPIGYLKVTRNGGPGDPPQASLVIYEPGKGPWRVTLDGRPLATLTPKAAPGEVQTSAVLAPAEAAALLAAAPNGAKLAVTAGATVTEISLAGSAAALRWMDARQRRAGTTSALVAKGLRPAFLTSALPTPPLVVAAAAVPQTGLPKTLPPSVRARLKDCDEDIDSLGMEPTIVRLAPGLVLWAPLCTRGAYNLIYSFLLSDEQGANVRPAAIPYPGGKATDTLMNADYDPSTQTLSNFDKARGLGDCGAETSWVWDGQAFRLSAQTVMPDCRGVLPDAWPTTFVSRAR